MNTGQPVPDDGIKHQIRPVACKCPRKNPKLHFLCLSALARKCLRNFPERHKGKEPMKTAIRSLVLLALLAVIALFLLRFWSEYQFRTRYNEGVRFFHAEDYAKAEEAFVRLLNRYTNGIRRHLIVDELVNCYRAFTLDPARSIADRAVYARKIQLLAPDKLNTEELQLLRQ
jgi:hypothetical protein